MLRCQSHPANSTPICSPWRTRLSTKLTTVTLSRSASGMRSLLPASLCWRLPLKVPSLFGVWKKSILSQPKPANSRSTTKTRQSLSIALKKAPSKSSTIACVRPMKRSSPTRKLPLVRLPVSGP